MLYNLPTTKQEEQYFTNEDIVSQYSVLSRGQKRKWLRTSIGQNGCIRISPADDPTAITINLWDGTSQAYARYSWSDQDPFDGGLLA